MDSSTAITCFGEQDGLSSQLNKPGNRDLSGSFIDNTLPPPVRKNITRPPTRPRSVSIQNMVIYSTSDPAEHKLVNGGHTEAVLDEAKERCSYCNMGIVENNFSFPGVVLCLICFPIGFVWLFCFMEKQCTHCGKMYT